MKTERKRRSDGERSRQTILRAAAGLATVDGLDGISIGNLASHIGMSKSGLYAHFGSKEQLQLATIDDVLVEDLEGRVDRRELQLFLRAEVRVQRSEEHTAELQSHVNLVCRLLLE